MKEEIIDWIKNWFEKKSGKAEGIIIGISGGKDSTVVAKLCCEAIGKERVFGVLMPNGIQKDIEDSKKVCKLLGIKYIIVNINPAYTNLLSYIEYPQDYYGEPANLLNDTPTVSDQAKVNIAPRIRMTVLYTIAQSMNYRVAGTGNLTEKVLGYFTKWGDGACDFNPLGDIYCTDVIKLGLELDLPEELIKKAPSDGLTGKTDEEVFDYTYEEIDATLREMQKGPFFNKTPLANFIADTALKNEHKNVEIPIFIE